MTDRLLDLPDHIRKRLAGALGSGLLVPPYSPASVRSVLGIGECRDILQALLDLGQLGIAGPAAAAWIRTVDKATARLPRPDFVWSGPEVPGLHARDTRRCNNDGDDIVGVAVLPFRAGFEIERFARPAFENVLRRGLRRREGPPTGFAMPLYPLPIIVYVGVVGLTCVVGAMTSLVLSLVGLAIPFTGLLTYLLVVRRRAEQVAGEP